VLLFGLCQVKIFFGCNKDVDVVPSIVYSIKIQRFSIDSLVVAVLLVVVLQISTRSKK